MNTLAIDIETYSSNDLIKGGVYKYVEAVDFAILLFAYSINGGPVKVVDLANGETLDPEIQAMLTDPAVLKTAFNANFERTCIGKHFNITLPADQWECTMVKGGMLGYPMSLEQAAKVMGLEAQKDNAGKALIRFFSIPCKPTKANGFRNRNLPEHAPDKWQQFKDYCVQDVVVEQGIRDHISWFDMPQQEKRLWHLDQQINDRGVGLDMQLVNNAISINAEYTEKLIQEATRLTNLDNPNSAAQLKTWLSEEMGEEVKGLTKKDVPELLKQIDSEVVKRVLTIRQELAKTSVKKYNAMAACCCQDNRVRGLIQFYGANRTGRFAGRLVQVQNLPQNKLKDLSLARELVLDNDLELLELAFGNVPDTLSQLIRTAFVAPEGKTFGVVDFSAIEARVIAWLAGERWRLDVFNTHGKIYEASASQMFKVPIEQITKGNPLRQKGKVAELALGYQGGPNALISMGALDMGIPEEELPRLVKMWRNSNKKIVQLWYDVQGAAIKAIETGEPVRIQHNIKFSFKSGFLIITLPSSRSLYYVNAGLVDGKFGPAIVYAGMNQTTKKWERVDTYGGKLVENIVQAIARDCLTDSMLRLDAAGFETVMHIHDEDVAEVYNEDDLKQMEIIMGEPIPWANGLPLRADGYLTKFYKKDD